MGRPGFKSPKMQYDDFRKKTYTPPPPPGDPIFGHFLAFFTRRCENDGRVLFENPLFPGLKKGGCIAFFPLFPGLKRGGA